MVMVIEIGSGIIKVKVSAMSAAPGVEFIWLTDIHLLGT
jgi:hypothetical protein